jgi:GT2 family glycosyltransferase/glycosyltransferase involved in cell wall biosynthesis
VLIVSYTAHPGGAERILADHATAIDPHAWAACPEGWLADRLREQGVRVFPLAERGMELRANPALALARLAAHSRETRRLAAALRPHTLVAWGMRAALACAPVVERLPGTRPRLVFQHNDLLPGPVVGRAVRAAAARADVVVALSEAIAADLDPRGQLGVEVIRPGVDLRRFVPAATPPAAPRALFLGALAPWKRPELAVEAAALAGVPLTIAGGALDAGAGGFDARLRAMASGRSSDVTLAGRLADPVPALQASSALLHCADREPYGMALVEALACGVPVVAPAAGGPREITDDSCARLYRAGDPQAAAAALRAALAERAELSAAARARAERLFDLGDSRRRYAELLDTAPEQNAAPAAGSAIALVTVLHDSEPEVRALMYSIDRHLPGARLVAVDSGSSDGGAQAVRDWGGNATVVDLGENAGYGRGTNAGIAAVEEPVTVVLNPDVELLDGSLAELAAEAVKQPGRILAPLVLLPDGRRQDSVHPEPGSAPHVQVATLPSAARGLAADPWRADEPRHVGWAVGCCFAARTDTLRRLGPFDERAFLYAEDIDLGLRASDAGIETWFWPLARVLHKQAHSTGRRFGGEAYELLAERRRAVVEERRGAAARTRDDLIQAATFASRVAVKGLLRKGPERERRQLAALIRTRRGRPGR